jgi:NAD(P)-dependent dehydrogenase (short-subunit alcohol dehydrogenase family)
VSASVVLITGALTGIGRATALAFAREGARIVVSGRRDEAGNALTQELRSLGVEAEFIRADVRHEDEVRDLIDKDHSSVRPARRGRQQCGHRRQAWSGDGADSGELRNHLRH